MRPARTGSRELHMTDRWMVRYQLRGCARQIRHGLIVAPLLPHRLFASVSFAGRETLAVDDRRAPSGLRSRLLCRGEGGVSA